MSCEAAAAREILNDEQTAEMTLSLREASVCSRSQASREGEPRVTRPFRKRNFRRRMIFSRERATAENPLEVYESDIP